MIHWLETEQIAETRGIESEGLYLSTSIKTLTDDDDDGKWVANRENEHYVKAKLFI